MTVVCTNCTKGCLKQGNLWNPFAELYGPGVPKVMFSPWKSQETTNGTRLREMHSVWVGPWFDFTTYLLYFIRIKMSDFLLYSLLRFVEVFCGDVLSPDMQTLWRFAETVSTPEGIKVHPHGFCQCVTEMLSVVSNTCFTLCKWQKRQNGT